MTTPADDAAVENAFEAYLAGRPVPEKAADLAVFAEAVRATATAPGRPNAALAELLATGLLADQSSPSVRTARTAGAPPSRGTSRTRNRRRFAMIFPVLLAKILSAGAVAQAATGAGIVVVVVTGAGATGALPDPVQDTLATVVETVTPLDLPSTDDEQLQDEETPDTRTDPAVPVDDTDDTDDTDEGDDTDEAESDEGDEADEADEAELTLEEWQAGPDEEQSFGSWVSSGARFGYVDGATVSKYAHLKKRGETEPATPPATPTEPADDTDAEVGDDSEETEAQSSTRGAGNGKKSSNGNGNGNGNGGGKSNGKGNGRN